MKNKILICNDDGFHAPGIIALHKAIADLGEVTVVAPATEQSGVGHAITVSNPIKIKKQKFNGQCEGYSVTGTPADCVKIAGSVLLGQLPDLVVSGINLGPNVGISVIYSGTVSAAAEGTILGVPSMAISLDTFEHPCWDTAAHIARMLANEILRKGLPPATMLNVNVPNLPLKEIKGLLITRVGRSRFAEVFHRRTMPRGDVYYWMDGELEPLEDVKGPGFRRRSESYGGQVAGGFARASSAGGETSPRRAEARTDIQAVRDGYGSITPITFDLTNHAVLSELERWDLKL